jgi:hypothetical protein
VAIGLKYASQDKQEERVHNESIVSLSSISSSTISDCVIEQDEIKNDGPESSVKLTNSIDNLIAKIKIKH